LIDPNFQVMDFEKSGHGKSWKSHGILKGRRCTNPENVHLTFYRTLHGFMYG
jgi:hypothetical protein